ncbi:MAG: nitroreductase family deazaflavin-dependent oxidoreductase [Thermoleophilaceae bacterium]
MARPDEVPRVVRLQKRFVNPLVRRAVDAGLVRSIALLETTGRKSGEPRRTPVGNGLDRRANTFWIVTERGHRTAYVRNIAVEPRVRIKVGRQWYSGTAVIMPEDDARERQRSMRRVNAAIVRAVGSELLTVRVDLDP